VVEVVRVFVCCVLVTLLCLQHDVLHHFGDAHDARKGSRLSYFHLPSLISPLVLLLAVLGLVGIASVDVVLDLWGRSGKSILAVIDEGLKALLAQALGRLPDGFEGPGVGAEVDQVVDGVEAILLQQHGLRVGDALDLRDGVVHVELVRHVGVGDPHLGIAVQRLHPLDLGGDGRSILLDGDDVFVRVIEWCQSNSFLVPVAVLPDRNTEAEAHLLWVLHLEGNLLLTVSTVLWIVLAIFISGESMLRLLSLTEVANEAVLVDFLFT